MTKTEKHSDNSLENEVVYKARGYFGAKSKVVICYLIPLNGSTL